MADQLCKHAVPLGRRRPAGFTLTELLVTITIAGVAAAVALPALAQFVQDSEVSTQTDYLVGSVNYARSEAVARNARVTMCRSTTGTACSPTAPVGNWRNGWIVFTDSGAVGTVDGTDQVLRVQSALKGKGEVLGTGNVADYISYVSSGQARLGTGVAQAGSLSVCSFNDKVRRRRVTLSGGTGWLSIVRLAGSSTCTA